MVQVLNQIVEDLVVIVKKLLVLEMIVDESLEMIKDESLKMIEDESLDMIMDETLKLHERGSVQRLARLEVL
ncbi:hypothetical protein Tco_0355128 [Tanacetum coccineum]